MKHDGSKAAVIKSTVFEDNNVALAKPKAVKLTPFTKHISVKYHSFKVTPWQRKRHHTRQGQNSSAKGRHFN